MSNLCVTLWSKDPEQASKAFSKSGFWVDYEEAGETEEDTVYGLGGANYEDVYNWCEAAVMLKIIYHYTIQSEKFTACVSTDIAVKLWNKYEEEFAVALDMGSMKHTVTSTIYIKEPCLFPLHHAIGTRHIVYSALPFDEWDWSDNAGGYRCDRTNPYEWIEYPAKMMPEHRFRMALKLAERHPQRETNLILAQENGMYVIKETASIKYPANICVTTVRWPLSKENL